MQKNFEYHEDLDILYVYSNPLGLKPVYSIVKGNIVVDFAEDGSVLGVEIDCLSRFFN